MIQDQYEEEFFVSYLKPKQTTAGSSQNSSEGSPNKGEAAVGPSSNQEFLIYKYFSEISEDEAKKFECNPAIGGNNPYILDRGNILGISVPNVNPWVHQILKDGKPDESINQEQD